MSEQRATMIVFEGIDGSGKTSLSTAVAERLRGAGLRVVHVREGGRYASRLTNDLRAFGRDARHLELRPEAELLLLATREAQLLHEVTLPALREADVVLTDRFFTTAEVLACHGRHLPPERVRPIIDAASGGVRPDLSLLVDTDPHLARMRRRVSKILSPDTKPPSRKGLAGAGLQHRLAAGYRAVAAAAPEEWLVVDNNEAAFEETVAHVAALVRQARQVGVAQARSEHASLLAPPRRAQVVASDVAGARDALAAWIERRAEREPHVAAYVLGGLSGGAFDPLRSSLAARAPQVLLAGLRGMDDEVAWEVRRSLLHRRAAVLASLHALAGGEADRLREALAPEEPAAVLRSLAGRDDEAAWQLRVRLAPSAPEALLASLGSVAGERADALRRRALEKTPAGSLGEEQASEAAALLAGRDDEAAWRWRERLFDEVPVAVLQSLRGLTSARAWAWRERWAAHAAKTVALSLQGLDDEPAWALRERLGRDCKEVLDGMLGLDSPAAWRLREALAEVWPSTAVKSLGPLAHTGRGRELVQRLLPLRPDDVALWRHVAALGTAAESSRDVA